jgi:ribose/xylose/arabinose/galactoside ABC-type transport system permease subunit
MKIFNGPYSTIWTLVVILVVVAVGMAIASPEKFLSLNNVQSMAYQVPILGLLSLAMMIAMITGGVNLSIIASAVVSGVVGATLLKTLVHPGMTDMRLAFAIVAAICVILGVSLLVGFVNGLIIGYAQVPAILGSLATMILLQGLAIGITKGGAVSGFPVAFQFIGLGLVFGIPIAILVFAFFCFCLSLLLNRTPWGYSLYMLGSNERATLYSGVNNKAILLRTYLLSGLLSGIAAIIMTSEFDSVKASYGSAYLLQTILVALLGGVSASGGIGTVSGVVIAILVLQCFSSGFNILGFSTFLTTAIWGLMLIIAMIITFVRERQSQLVRTIQP